jgi:hypothetical protein
VLSGPTITHVATPGDDELEHQPDPARDALVAALGDLVEIVEEADHAESDR